MPSSAVTCAHAIGRMLPYWSIQYTPPCTDPATAPTTWVVEMSTERTPADNARRVSNRVLRFKSDSARSLVRKSDKSFEVPRCAPHWCDRIISMIEPCIDSHPFVDRFPLVLILETLSPQGMSSSNDENVILWFAGRYLEAKQVASVLRFRASNPEPKRPTRSGTVLKSYTRLLVTALCSPLETEGDTS